MSIDKTDIYFELKSRVTIADEDDKTVSLKPTGTSMRCTILHGLL